MKFSQNKGAYSNTHSWQGIILQPKKKKKGLELERVKGHIDIIYIYIYITETFETSTIFHISTTFKYNIKTN